MNGWLLRLYRLCMLGGLVWLLRDQSAWFAGQRAVTVSLDQVRSIFPNAASLTNEGLHRQSHRVLSASGEEIGTVLVTWPQADHVVGYSGPSRLLLGLDAAGAVRGIVILSSGDTPEHVAMVREQSGFFAPFTGWRPGQDPLPEIDAVSGATLTSLAMAETVETRLLGAAPSLRFPEPLTLAEARGFFPQAAALDSEGRVRNASGEVLGQLWRTSPAGDNVSGFRGPTECLLALTPDGRQVLQVAVRKSFDTASYVDQVREDPAYLQLFAGRTVETLAGMDFEKEGVEGVSGATLTSYAVAESIRRRSRLATSARSAGTVEAWRWSRRDFTLAAFLAGACVLGFSPLRGWPRLRLVWQAGLVLLLGLTGGDLLSLALLAGWAQHGVPWQTAPGLLLLAAVSLAVPWAFRRQIYCHHLCPHGAVQQWVGLLRRKKWSPPERLGPWLEKLPAVLLAGAVLLLLTGATVNLAAWEPFDAWVLRAGAWGSLGIAVAGLAAACFIPQAYCRYGCPTGALLRFLRTPGTADRFGKRDWAALVLSVVAVMVTLVWRHAWEARFPMGFIGISG